jgi:hypothetical protein
MNLGTFIAGQTVWVTVCCHRPATGEEWVTASGEEYAGTVTGYYQRMTGAPGAGTALSFSQFNSETGVYYAPIDTTGFTKGSYAVLVEATVDGVAINVMHTFTVLDPADFKADVTNLDVAVSTRSTLTQAQVLSDATPFAGANVAAIKAKTDNLPASPAAVGSAMTLADGAITAAVIATGAVDADAIAADAIGASELAADAVTEIQNGLATSANQTTILANQTTLLARIGAFTGTGVNTILGFLKALASKAATLPSDIGGTFTPTTDSLEALQENEEEIDADVWAYTTRTLTQAAASVVSAVTGSSLTITAYVDYSATLTGLTIPSTWTKMWFTVKLEEEDADSESIIQIQVSNPADATNDGLLYLEGAAYATKTDGSLTVNQSGGTVAIALKAAATDGLTRRRKLGYDVKVLTSAGARTQLTLGSCDVVLTETHALS